MNDGIIEKPIEDMLSNEMKAAAEIYRFNLNEEKVWFTKLANSLKGHMAPSTLHNALKALRSWGVIRTQYGETDTGKAGRLLRVAGEAEETIALVYNQYWMGRKK